MTRARLLLCLAVGLLLGAAPPNPPARIEFRWMEWKPVKGLTVMKGEQTSCAPDSLAYAHLKPVLGNAAVASATLNTIEWSGVGTQHMVDFRLTDAAKKTLVAQCAGKEALLAVYIDGRRWGVMFFNKADAATFAPSAGFMTSKPYAERIVASVPK
ncbi:MAG: hypothetical protein K2W96_08085 [Gemmataceae bacterium]|nr:hypothetical protein [Gemmataceae bacterium]